MTDLKAGEVIRDRACGALLGLAIGDALGAPVEFKERDSFPRVLHMQSGGYFGLPIGAWTDDTAMALCLADSLLHDPDLDRRDLLNRFVRWIEAHENTSTGKCIGVGQNTLAVLGNFNRTGALEALPICRRSDGNGALMRLAPVACRHWSNKAKAKSIARAQSRATHASDKSAAGCDMVAALLCDLISGVDWQDAFAALAKGGWPEGIRQIVAGDWKSKSRDEIRSTGYVVDTLEAAVWAVGTTSSFEEALMRAVNLGHDADTVGAVTGQLAGARYGESAFPVRWTDVLIKRYEIEKCAQALFLAGWRAGSN